MNLIVPFDRETSHVWVAATFKDYYSRASHHCVRGLVLSELAFYVTDGFRSSG